MDWINFLADGGAGVARAIESQHGNLVEEIPDAYKDVNDVVDVVQGAGIAKKVVRLKPNFSSNPKVE